MSIQAKQSGEDGDRLRLPASINGAEASWAWPGSHKDRKSRERQTPDGLARDGSDSFAGV